MEISGNPLRYSFDRHTEFLTGGPVGNLPDQQSELYAVLPTEPHLPDNFGYPRFAETMPSTISEVPMEAPSSVEGHACCPLCFTAFGSLAQASLVRLSCGTVFIPQEPLNASSRIFIAHIAHLDCTLTVRYASDTHSCPQCLVPLDWEQLKTVFWTGVEDCGDPER